MFGIKDKVWGIKCTWSGSHSGGPVPVESVSEFSPFSSSTLGSPETRRDAEVVIESRLFVFGVHIKDILTMSLGKSGPKKKLPTYHKLTKTQICLCKSVSNFYLSTSNWLSQEVLHLETWLGCVWTLYDPLIDPQRQWLDPDSSGWANPETPFLPFHAFASGQAWNY